MNVVDNHRVYCFTVATKPHPGLEMLLDTYRHHGIAVDVHGMYDSRLREWGEDTWVKMDYLARVLKGLQPNTIILFTDAFDVLCTQPLSFLLGRFLEVQKPIVFAAEKDCFPEDMKPLYPLTNQNFTDSYLNSGVFMGYVWALRKMLKEMGDYKRAGYDQRYCALAYLKMPELIHLDQESRVFMCMPGKDLSNVTFSQGKGYHKNTGISFLHFNGPKHALVPMYGKWRQSTARWKRRKLLGISVTILIIIALASAVFWRRDKIKPSR